VGEFILGAAMMVYGTHLKSDAGRRLAGMSHTVSVDLAENEGEQRRAS
jgi:hypothetical protein